MINNVVNKSVKIVIGLVSLAMLIFVLLPLVLQPEIQPLNSVVEHSNKPTLFDRNGKILSYTLERGWNISDQMPLHAIPELMQNAFIISEDKRFYQHHGVDWLARINALKQDIIARHFVRGASTISEQVVRILVSQNQFSQNQSTKNQVHQQNLWSKWLAGFSARSLERKESKIAILEFYLNQVPYSAERRGIKQAARYYFNRDVDTLSPKEILALVVIVRAPSIYSAETNQALLNTRIEQLSSRLLNAQLITTAIHQQIINEKLTLTKTKSSSNVYHFANFIWAHSKNADVKTPQHITTTLDSDLQESVKKLLDARVKQLSPKKVNNGAVLVVDHQTHEILVWAVSGDLKNASSGAYIDAVLAPRQPGSTLKPFIYTMALEKGWTAATIIKDEPLQTPVGNGEHIYRNYSHTFYGDLTLRETLGNSLNIPAIKTLEYIGSDNLLKKLKQIGMQDLNRHASVYGAGLALGNGEVSLFELVQAYTVLADKGIYLPLKATLSNDFNKFENIPQPVFSPAATSIISNILSDAKARQLEFGRGSSLNFLLDTAAKTGTSTDYVDAWIVAYNYRYVVGIWLGNLDRKPMQEVTGSTGPALLAHAIFSELNRGQETQPLFLSRSLIKQPVCIAMTKQSEKQTEEQGECLYRDEWFMPNTAPPQSNPFKQEEQKSVAAIHIVRPSNQLHMAMDPRIPDALEAYEFSLNQENNIQHVKWFVNGKLFAETNVSKVLWHLQRGEQSVKALVRLATGDEVSTNIVAFTVK